MRVLGISPLDKDATVSLVEDGKVLYAAAEKQFGREKQHAGFPRRALEQALKSTGTRPEEIDRVAYPFFKWDREAELIAEGFAHENRFHDSSPEVDLDGRLAEAKRRVPSRTEPIHGLTHPNQRMDKGALKELFYRLVGTSAGLSSLAARYCSQAWIRQAVDEHRHWNQELESGLAEMGLDGKLRRYDHHLSHAANAYYASGLERALIVTLDGYGSGLAGSVCLGEEGKIRRLHELHYPFSLGTYYESVTASLGFNPLRHGERSSG